VNEEDNTTCHILSRNSEDEFRILFVQSAPDTGDTISAVIAQHQFRRMRRQVGLLLQVLLIIFPDVVP
jgi:hypothetical protein